MAASTSGRLKTLAFYDHRGVSSIKDHVANNANLIVRLPIPYDFSGHVKILIAIARVSPLLTTDAILVAF